MSLEDIIEAAKIHQSMKDPDVAHLVIGLNKVISSHAIAGLDVQTEEFDEGVTIHIRLADGVKVAKPVHMCFGLLQEQGIQRINTRVHLGPDSAMSVLAHCVFPNATDVKHIMDGRITIAAGAQLEYIERHVHSDSGGLYVAPKSVVELGENARFKTDFELLQGRVGVIEIDYETTCQAHSVLEMTAKVRGRGNDRIVIRETGHLVGDHAVGVLTSRVAVRDQAVAEIYNKLTASAAFARGHVDCKEILQDQAQASAVPVVEVRHPKAHVTHEAALGSVDTKQLETLMARGLNEDDASDLIIQGLLS